LKAEMEELGLSGFERFLYIFFIPIVFAVIGIGVLLSLFDTNIYNNILKQANKIPLVGAIVPEPKVIVKTKDPAAEVPEIKIKNQNQKIADLTKKLTDQRSPSQKRSIGRTIKNENKE
jgi:hypothetical protein